MDRELRAWRALTTRLPPVPKAMGVANHLVRRAYLRRPREPVTAPVLGFDMTLDPAELVDGLLLFCPHLYDRAEVALLRRTLYPGDTFLDLGAHIGFYSLVAAGLVGPTGTVLAVEPEPRSLETLRRNVARNGAAVTIADVGLSDRTETRRLTVNTSGNRGSSSLLDQGPTGVWVSCVPLPSLLAAHDITEVTAAKLDLEGMEYRVLADWLGRVPPHAWPRVLIVEHHAERVSAAGGDVRDLLVGAGYAVRPGSRHNLLATRS